MKADNYIYIYDTDRHKVIIIDGETGEEIEEKDDRVSSILNYLKEQEAEDKLRKFAVWCAHQCNKEFKPLQTKMIELAEKAIQGEKGQEDLKQLFEETEGQAIATDTVGLRQGSVNAPAFLATRECVNPDAFEGALQAARFHRLWAELKEESDEGEEKKKGTLKEIEIDAGEDTVQKTEQEQIDYLLDLIGVKS